MFIVVYCCCIESCLKLHVRYLCIFCYCKVLLLSRTTRISAIENKCQVEVEKYCAFNIFYFYFNKKRHILKEDCDLTNYKIHLQQRCVQDTTT